MFRVHGVRYDGGGGRAGGVDAASLRHSIKTYLPSANRTITSMSSSILWRLHAFFVPLHHFRIGIAVILKADLVKIVVFVERKSKHV